MKRSILSLGALTLMALSSNVEAQQYEEYYGKTFDVSCDRIVSETYASLKDNKNVNFVNFYKIQKNCLKVPMFSEVDAETKGKTHKGYSVEILKVDRNHNIINDILVFRIFDQDGQLISNILYEASDVTGEICNKLIDAFDMKNNRLGCDGTYDFKSFGDFPSKENPMQREIGQDIEKLAEYLLNQKAKEIIDQDIKKKKK